MKLHLTLLCHALSVAMITGQTIQWNGGTGYWNVPSNWDCTCIPAAHHYVIVEDGTVTIPAGFQAEAWSIIVESDGVLINQDTLRIANNNTHGIEVFGLFENYRYVSIRHALISAILVEEELQNFGQIIMDSLNGTGLYLSTDDAVVINDGLFDITCKEDGFGIFSTMTQGIIHNQPDGEMYLRDSRSFGATIDVHCDILNEGLIHSYRGDIGGLGRLFNEGTLIMDNPDDDTQQGLNLRVVINSAAALISIRNTSTWALINNDTFLNHGVLDVSKTFTDAFNLGDTYFVNTGHIRIDSTGRYGILTGLNTTFRNEASGSIRIARTVSAGLKIDRIKMYNNGLIRLDTVGSPINNGPDHGIECALMGAMVNDTFGQIIIDSCYGSGINLTTDSLSENHGSIQMRQIRVNGIGLSGNHTFLNSGRVDIDTLQGVGIIMTTAGSTFENTGTISIGSKMDLTDFSINNSGTFINDSCGHVYTVNRLRNSNDFVNYGFLKNRSTNTHTFTAGGNTINEGVISDYTGFINSNTNVDNYGIILNAKTTLGCPAATVNNAMTLGSHSGFEVTGIHAAIPGRPLIAVYDTMTNVAHHTDIFPETGDWLWVIRHIQTGCQDSMEVKMTVNCPVSCMTGDTTYWVGCNGTDAWTAANNWSGGVPGIVSTVVIPYLSLRPYPMLITPATIHSMWLRRAAAFEIQTGSLLSIE